MSNKAPAKQVIMSQTLPTVISSEPENQVCEVPESVSEEKEPSEMEVDEEAYDQEEGEKHVGFEVEYEEYAGARPNRLHRRDTPHHLKNKRINANIDHNKVASIIAQVRLEFPICTIKPYLIDIMYCTLYPSGIHLDNWADIFCRKWQP